MFNKQETSKLTCHNQHTKKPMKNINIFSLVEDFHRGFCLRSESPIDSFFFWRHDLDQHFFQELKAVYLGPDS